MCGIVTFGVWEGEDGGEERFKVLIVCGEGWEGGVLYCAWVGGLSRWGLCLLVGGGQVGGMTISCVCDNKDSVVLLLCLGYHFSPFDGLGDEGSIC